MIRPTNVATSTTMNETMTWLLSGRTGAIALNAGTGEGWGGEEGVGREGGYASLVL